MKMNHTNYIESVAANETSWQNTFDGIELLETNILRFKDINFVDLEQSIIEPRQESKYSSSEVWQFQKPPNSYHRFLIAE